MTVFKFHTIGENLGTRILGEKTRNMLLPMIESGDKVVLDFEGVNVVSNSFADECLAGSVSNSVSGVSLQTS